MKFLAKMVSDKKKMKKLALIFSCLIKQRLNAKLDRHYSNKNGDLTKTAYNTIILYDKSQYTSASI